MSMLDTLQGVFKDRDFSQLDNEQREVLAQDLVRSSAFASAALVAVPIPLSELLLMTPVNIAMLVGLGRIYGKPLSKSEAREVLTELLAAAGSSVVTSRLWVSLSKILLPGFGVYLFIPYVYAVTWALGRLAMQYFAEGDKSAGAFTGRFQTFVDEGKKAFSYRAFRDFLRRHGEDIKSSAAQDSDQAEQTAQEAATQQDAKTTAAAASASKTEDRAVVDADWAEPKLDTGPQPKESKKKPAGKKSLAKKATAKKKPSKKAKPKKAKPTKAKGKKAAAKKSQDKSAS